MVQFDSLDDDDDDDDNHDSGSDLKTTTFRPYLLHRKRKDYGL